MSPKRQENPVPCWIVNILETVSNQWQGCFQGAVEKYLRLIILAGESMVCKWKYVGFNQVLRTAIFGRAWKRLSGQHSGFFTSFGHLTLCVNFWGPNFESFESSEEYTIEIFIHYFQAHKWKVEIGCQNIHQTFLIIYFFFNFLSIPSRVCWQIAPQKPHKAPLVEPDEEQSNHICWLKP